MPNMSSSFSCWSESGTSIFGESDSSVDDTSLSRRLHPNLGNFVFFLCFLVSTYLSILSQLPRWKLLQLEWKRPLRIGQNSVATDLWKKNLKNGRYIIWDNIHMSQQVKLNCWMRLYQTVPLGSTRLKQTLPGWMANASSLSPPSIGISSVLVST